MVAGPVPIGFGGKGSRRETLPGMGAKSTLVPGETASRMMNQYGKGHSYLPPEAAAPPAPHPASHPGASMIRGSGKGFGKHLKEGGLGPGRPGAAPAADAVATAGKSDPAGNPTSMDME